MFLILTGRNRIMNIFIIVKANLLKSHFGMGVPL